MIPASLCLLLLGLAALWTLRDVVLRLHRGSEAHEAIEAANAAHERVTQEAEALRTEIAEYRAGVDARVKASEETVERVRSEHNTIKAKMAMAPGRRG